MSPAKTFEYRLVRRIHIAVHRPGQPSDDEWREYLADIGRRIELIDGVLVFAPHGELSRAQRGQASQFWKQQHKVPPLAVVTPSLLVVRTVGALRWFIPSQIRVFLTRDVGQAYEYLKLSSEQRQAVERCVRELAREQGLPVPLDS